MERDTTEGLEADKNYVDQMKEIDEAEDVVQNLVYHDAAVHGIGASLAGRHIPMDRLYKPTPEELAKQEAHERRYERRGLLVLAAELGFVGDDAIRAARQLQEFIEEDERSGALAGHPSPADPAQEEAWRRQRALDQAIGSFGHDSAPDYEAVIERARIFYNYVNGTGA